MGCSVDFKYAKMHWRPGLLPGPHWGAHDAWGGGHQSQCPTPSAYFFGLTLYEQAS